MRKKFGKEEDKRKINMESKSSKKRNSWKKVSVDKDSIIWELNEDTPEEVFVIRDCDGAGWTVMTLSVNISAKSKEDAEKKAIQWMNDHPHLKDIVKMRLKPIIDGDDYSLLAHGAEFMLKEILEFSHYKLDLEDIKEMLEDLFQDTKDSEVKELIKTLSEKKDPLEEFRKEKIKERENIRNNREKINKARQELQLQNARPVTNKSLEGKTIMIETTKTINNELMAFFHLKEKEEKKLRFKPSYFQRQKLFSWGMGPEEWPLEVRVVRSPKRKHFVFTKPVKVYAFFFNDMYIVTGLPDGRRLPGGRGSSLKSVQEILFPKLQKYFNKEKWRFEVETEEELKKIKEITNSSGFYDFEFIKDYEPFVVVAPIDKECIHRYEDGSGEIHSSNLKEVCLAYKIENNQQIFLMRSEWGADNAVKDYGAKKLNPSFTLNFLHKKI